MLHNWKIDFPKVISEYAEVISIGWLHQLSWTVSQSDLSSGKISLPDAGYLSVIYHKSEENRTCQRNVLWRLNELTDIMTAMMHSAHATSSVTTAIII